ncbi:hypothetical protein B0H14DRAFT_3618729 [Mycena olivaceomarginata]|nr:hypothetical protein B0H14DRAFT_3618729 [Mycena olivaceomarginata]
MSRTRDNPDPTLIVSGSRSRRPSDRLADPSNGEPLDPAHKSSVAGSGGRPCCWRVFSRSGVGRRVLVAAITVLIDQIESLCSSLPKSIPKGTQDDRISYVLNKIKGPDTGALAKSSTFVLRMDLLFGSDVRNDDGRFIHIRRGPWSVPLLIQYFRKINWISDRISLATATLKLTQILEEMRILWLVNSVPIVATFSGAL